MAFYLHPEKDENGQYSGLQDLYVPGMLLFPDEFFPIFHPEDKRCAGFVDIEHDGRQVTACVWNEAAYQAYVEANPEVPLPEPAPSQLDMIEAQVTYTAMITDTLLPGV